MRELGIFTDSTQARVLADYLLTQDITTKLVTNRDGRCGIWVQREDRLIRAREIYAEFLQRPDDLQFQTAARTAREIRKRTDVVEKQHAKQSRRLIDRWEGPLYRRAPITYALLAISIATFVGEKFNGRVYEWLAFSLVLITPDGGQEELGLTLVQEGQVWRLLTPIFMHFGPWHIIFNMLGLASLGQRIEMAKGSVRTLLFVILTGVGSNLGQFTISGGGFGGMSGVLFAMAGYLWMKGQVAPGEGLGLDNRTAQIFFAWFLLGVFATQMSPQGDGMIFHMANMAHGVGLVLGLVLALLRF